VTRSTQQKVIDIIEHQANVWDLELIDDRKFSNTGVLRIQGRDSLRDMVAIKYDFQHGYCSLKVIGVDPEFGPGVVGSGYIETDEQLVKVVGRLVDHIREHRR